MIKWAVFGTFPKWTAAGPKIPYYYLFTGLYKAATFAVGTIDLHKEYVCSVSCSGREGNGELISFPVTGSSTGLARSNTKIVEHWSIQQNNIPICRILDSSTSPQS